MQIAYEIDLEIQRFIKECYERAKQILTENRDKFELIAKTLLEVETLDADQIKYLFEEGRMPNDMELLAGREGTEKNNTVSEQKNAPEQKSDVKVNINSKTEEVNEETPAG